MNIPITLNLKKVIENRDKLNQLQNRVLELDDTINKINDIKIQLNNDGTKINDLQNQLDIKLNDIVNNFASKDDMRHLITELETSLQDVIFSSTPRETEVVNFQEMQEQMQEQIDNLRENVQLIIHENESLKNKITNIENDNKLPLFKTALDIDRPVIPKKRIINLKKP